jgi:hypothetical protein
MEKRKKCATSMASLADADRRRNFTMTGRSPAETEGRFCTTEVCTWIYIYIKKK